MLSNTFEDIRLKFEGSYYGGHYDIEIFADGRFYYSFVEGDSTDLQRGSFQISQREIMLFEELMDYFDFLKSQRNYVITEYRFGNSVLIIQKKNGREEKIEAGKEMMFSCAKIILEKYLPRNKRVYLMDSQLIGTKYIRNYEAKVIQLSEVDLFREFSRVSINTVAVYNKRKEKIGYLPKEHSEVIARLIDAGKKIYALSIPNDEGIALKIYMND